MNAHDDPMADDLRLIDRLVDGELDAATRRALLARFEAEPDGWRRCALAFLEAQSWREALTPVAEGSAPSLVASRVPAGRARPTKWVALPALAAGLLASFALGWSVGGSGTRTGPPPVASRPAAKPAPVRTVARTAEPAWDAPTPPVAIVAVPVATVGRAAPTVPERLRRSLERQGFEVEPRRGLVSMTLKDGRRVAVPVEAVKVHYVGSRNL